MHDAPFVPPRTHILTVALEDYFQGAAFTNVIGRRQWSRFETRFEKSTLAALDLLSRHEANATFFVNGWVAERRPDLVREVVSRGHSIASSGLAQKSFRLWPEDEFREDLRRSRDLIEDASGLRVQGYRVADHRLQPSDLWALRVLAEEGYEYDSSLSPSGKAFASEPQHRILHRHEVGEGRSIWEVPLSAIDVAGWQVPVAGGNYFRQFPEAFIKYAVARWIARETAPFVLYFRVWDLDLEQPKITAAPWMARLRHYRNPEQMAQLLEHFLSQHAFASVERQLSLLPAAVAARAAVPMEVQLAPVPAKPPASRRPATVVIPCYNEELVLPYLVNTLRSGLGDLETEYDFRYCFVDDGSTDSTWTSLQQSFASDPRCTLVRQPRNKGVAAAILTGISHARTEIVCSMDCDCTYDPYEFRHMIPLLESGVDLVTASPYHPSGGILNVPAWRLLFSRGCSFLYRQALGSELHTFTSCFRVYRRSAFADIQVKQSGFLGIAEMLGLLLLRGGRVLEHPATLEVRMLGHSKMKVARTTWGHIWLLLGFARRRLFGSPQRAVPGSQIRLERNNL